MIEAVNSVLSNVGALKGPAVQQSAQQNLTANPDKIQVAAKTPYVSPYISIDRNYNKAVIQIRDSDTGDVLRQYPTESQMKAYREAQQISERREQQSNIYTGEQDGNNISSSAPSPASSNIEAPAQQSVSFSESA